MLHYATNLLFLKKYDSAWFVKYIEEQEIRMLKFLRDNIFVEFGGRIFQQV